MRCGLLGGITLVLAGLTAQGCGDSGTDSLFDGDPSGLVDGLGDGGMSGTDSGAGSDSGSGSDSGTTGSDSGSGSGSGTTDDGCEFEGEASVERAPADIVMALDTSGSMNFEFCQVGLNLAEFADGVGPDTRVTTIYDADADFVNSLTSGLFNLFGLPEDTAGCGGEDPFANTTLAADDTRYQHLATEVDSHNALEVMLSEYGSYADFLRPESPLHFIVVTDDTSSIPGEDFRSQMEATLGRPFYFHAIAYTGDNMGMTGCRGDTGQEYLDLATATGGEQLSICASDWSQLFAELEAAVQASAPLPCSFDIPDSPPGQVFDSSLVSAIFTPEGGERMTFVKAESSEACGDEPAWHFDDETAPTRIEFCASACTVVRDELGDLEVGFGCAPPVLQ